MFSNFSGLHAILLQIYPAIMKSQNRKFKTKAFNMWPIQAADNNINKHQRFSTHYPSDTIRFDVSSSSLGISVKGLYTRNVKSYCIVQVQGVELLLFKFHYLFIQSVSSRYLRCLISIAIVNFKRVLPVYMEENLLLYLMTRHYDTESAP